MDFFIYILLLWTWVIGTDLLGYTVVFILLLESCLPLAEPLLDAKVNIRLMLHFRTQ